MTTDTQFFDIFPQLILILKVGHQVVRIVYLSTRSAFSINYIGYFFSL